MIFKDTTRIYDSSRTCLTNNNRDYMRSRGLLFLHMDILHSFKITPIGQLNQEMTKKTNLMFSKKWAIYDVLSWTIILRFHKLMWYTFRINTYDERLLCLHLMYNISQDKLRSYGIVWISLHLLISCENPSSTHKSL